MEEKNYQEQYASIWNINPSPLLPIVSICGTKTYLGGFNVFNYMQKLEKTFSGLPSHYMFMIKIIILKIDDWATSSSIAIFIDDTFIRDEVLSNYNNAVWSINLCGDSFQKDQETFIEHSFFHNKET